MLSTDYQKMMNILMVLGVLLKHSSEEKPIGTLKEIAELLEKEYDVPFTEKNDTKTIKRNMTALEIFLEHADFGYTLTYESESKTRKGNDAPIRNGWYLMRDVTRAEIDPIINELLFSRYIPHKSCQAIIKGLESMAGIVGENTRRQPLKKVENLNFLQNVEVLVEAIEKTVRVVFKGLERVTDSDNRPRIALDPDGTPHEYKVSPYEIVVSNGRHYLICSHNKGDELFHYRIDQIKDVRFLLKDDSGDYEEGNYVRNRPINELSGHKQGLNIARYMQEHIYMCPGSSIDVTFRAYKTAYRHIVGQIRDWFGENVTFMNEDKNSVLASVRVNEEAMLYWALQYGGAVEITSPITFRKRVAETVSVMYNRYKNAES